MIYTNFEHFVLIWMGVGIVTFLLLLKIPAPYGRHISNNWGMKIDNRAGWVAMELPALLVFIAAFAAGGGVRSLPVWIMFFYWVLHYSYRSLWYPLKTRTGGKGIPLLIVLLAVAFNFVNAGINGWYFSHFQPGYSLSWLTDPRFIIGTLLFFSGMIINRHSDNILIRLRNGRDGEYFIPRGFLFELISCPNHLGEILEWTGFAVAAWNLPATAFALWTAANVLPRSLAHHRWYRQRFHDYPAERRAVIPYIL